MEKQDLIESLTPLEHVRLRSGMYAGDTSNTNQLLLEAFANALDMHTIGYGNLITVNVSDNGLIQVEDIGKGFPINEIREDGLTTLEAAYSVMNTSGKYRDDGLYEGTSLGLNGVGAKICNFLSHWCEVLSYQNGQYEHIWFEEGVFKNRELGKWDSENNYSSGTTLTFLPSEEFFGDVHINEKYFIDFFNDIACLCPNLTIVFNNKRISHPNGIEDLVVSRVNDDIEITNSRLIIEEKNFCLGLTYSERSSASLVPYVNYGLTETGPHITAIKSAITRELNSWARENRLLKDKDKNLDGNALQEGLILVFNLISQNVAYNAQVKNQIMKCDTTFVNDIFIPQFEIWLDNNPEDGKNIIEKALLARKAAEAAKKAREAVKNKALQSNKKFANLPSKLADCSCKNREDAELFLTEGDSASGGAKMIRDPKTQAVLGLKGKVLNCLTNSPKKMLANAEIVDILKALGFDYNISVDKNGNESLSVIYNEDKLRYGKLIIAADRDSDGSHIQCLILSMLWKLVPDMILDGHVYIAEPPLYKAEFGTKYKYLSDKKELEEFKKSHNGKFSLTYFKGLGEASAEELGWMIMNRDTRKISRVEINDYGLSDIVINNLMGGDSKPKKDFVFGNKVSEII